MALASCANLFAHRQRNNLLRHKDVRSDRAGRDVTLAALPLGVFTGGLAVLTGLPLPVLPSVPVLPVDLPSFPVLPVDLPSFLVLPSLPDLPLPLPPSPFPVRGEAAPDGQSTARWPASPQVQQALFTAPAPRLGPGFQRCGRDSLGVFPAALSSCIGPVSSRRTRAPSAPHGVILVVRARTRLLYRDALDYRDERAKKLPSLLVIPRVHFSVSAQIRFHPGVTTASKPPRTDDSGANLRVGNYLKAPIRLILVGARFSRNFTV